MKKPIVHVTDHAVLRYLERVVGFDIEAIRREIGKKVDAVRAETGARGVISDGFVYRIEGDRVVTVMEHNRPDIRFGRARGQRDD